MMKKSELRLKDVVDINRGKKLGYINDVDINVDNGSIKAVIIPSYENIFLKFFLITFDLVINLDDIKKIGEDVVLVDMSNV